MQMHNNKIRNGIPSGRLPLQEIKNGNTNSRLKTENKNTEALEDYVRDQGCPNSIKTDCAQSKFGVGWTEYCRRHFINQLTIEPKHLWQNPSEKRIGYVGVW